MNLQYQAGSRKKKITAATTLFALLLSLLGAPALLGAGATAYADAGSTVTGGIAWKWDPNDLSNPGQPFDSPRTVTVDQTSNLVSQVVHVSWTNFSASSTTSAQDSTSYPLRVYECDRANPTTPADCFGTLTYGDKHPGYGYVPTDSNRVAAVTGPDGTGGIDFPVLTGADNPSLGCSPTHDCSLVIEPITGGDSDGKDSDGNPGLGDGSAPECDDHSLDFNLDPNTYVGNFATVNATALDDWDKGCNWASRIVVPLHFGKTPTDCPQRSADFASEGSPLLQRAVDQWRAGICRGSNGSAPLQVGYAALSEYQARNDFEAGSTDVALTSQPVDQARRPGTYAPVGISSIAIGYYVDNANTGRPITDLRLNARLLAKMLTQSYTAGLGTNCTDGSAGSYGCAPEVAGNPRSLFSDPEFLALNPGHQPSDFPTGDPGSSFPTALFGDSDQTYQLTSWIAADPSAAAFLNGQPDRWGMHVNTSYLPPTSPTYPVSQFTANDPGRTFLVKNCGTISTGDSYSCLNAGMQNSWFPVVGMRNVAKTLLAGKDSAKSFASGCSGSTVLPTGGVCVNYANSPSYPQGQRAAFAIVAGGDAAAYRFPTAELETRTGSGAFVADSTEAMTAAVNDLTSNPDKLTQRLNYAKLNDPSAYPLTAVNYALVPTCGLTGTKATAVANFLRYAASDTGNVYGVNPGQLAPGYLALPAALRAQTNAAADRIASETACPSAPVRTGGAGGGSSPGAKPPTANQPGASPGGANAGPPAANAGGPAAAPLPAAAPTKPTGLLANPVAFGKAHPDSAGLAAIMLPLLLILGAVLVVLGPVAMLLGGTPAGAALQLRLRRVIGIG